MATPTAKRLKPNSLDLIVVHPIDAAAGHISKSFFIANRAYEVVAAQETHTTASSSGTLQLKKCVDSQAPASGVNLTTAPFNTSAGASFVASGTITPTLANRTLAAGDRIALQAGGTATNYAGGCIVVTLRPLEV